MDEFYRALCRAAGEEQVKRQESMALHTTFRTGGPAAFFASVKTEEELRETVGACREYQVPYYMLGNGSNLLVGSAGFPGVMIRLDGELKEWGILREEEDGRVLLKAGAGLLLSKIGRAALEEGLTGFEFAAGIPGTLGGAAVMNAGAYGGEMKDILVSVRVMTPDGQVEELPASGLQLSYRHSCIPERGYAVLSAVMELKRGNKEEIRERMEDLAFRRRDKQPLEYPSAGSTFKRPEGYFAGKLIEDAGLKGYSVGGAQVSEKHAGFVINRENASPEEIRDLIEAVRTRVFETSGVRLEPEVKLLGFGPSAWGDTASADSKRSN